MRKQSHSTWIGKQDSVVSLIHREDGLVVHRAGVDRVGDVHAADETSGIALLVPLASIYNAITINACALKQTYRVGWTGRWL